MITARFLTDRRLNPTQSLSIVIVLHLCDNSLWWLFINGAWGRDVGLLARGCEIVLVDVWDPSNTVMVVRSSH